jgi:hypothetical protein
MNTTDQPPPMTLAQTATVMVRHLTDHGLPEPASLHLTTDRHSYPEIRVQLAHTDLAALAAALLAWAATLTAVSFQAWRPPQGPRVHLELHATLTYPTGSVAVLVYVGIACDPALFAGLEPGQTKPLTLGQLTEWAGHTGAGVAA